MSRPFEGVRILDFTQVFAGPFASYQLSLLGAEVIKVERPGGEDLRYTAEAKDWADRGLSPMWIAVNANKRNIALDLKHPKSVEIVKRLATESDVVMENFRPGVMDRLGIGHEALAAVNPKIIYCGVSGFGQEGPARDVPAYDGRIQATSGIMSVTGHPEMGPTRAGFAVCDAIAGMTSAFAVSSALYQRTHTGKGQFIDVAMFDSALAFLAPMVCEYTLADTKHVQYGNMAVSRKPTSNLFPVKDGHILLSVNSEKQFIGLMNAIGRSDLLEDPRFADWDLRKENEAALQEAIKDAFAEADAETWAARLDEADAPAARIWSIGEAVAHPQLDHREVLQTIDSSDGPMTVVGSGFTFAHGGGTLERPPAQLNEHAEEILAEAGYAASEIEAFRDEGVF
jgi:crotonobetainyl-CoA:carnitine CoA-transferase CaiB-like acyl-CoA transferase